MGNVFDYARSNLDLKDIQLEISEYSIFEPTDLPHFVSAINGNLYLSL